MNKAQIQKLIDSPPPSWEKMFKRYKLKKPTVDQLINTVLDYTPSMRSSGERGSAKYKVPAKVKKEAALALQLAWKHNWTSDSGVGLVRAMQLLVRPNIWERSVRRMKAYFTRHQRDKKFKGFGSKTKPSRGYIAWLAWGGDSGKKWVDGLKLRNPAQYSNEVEELEEYLKNKYNLHPRINRGSLVMYISSAGFLKIATIRIPQLLRGKGIGSQVMKEIIAFADKKGLPIALTPEPEKDTKRAKNRLIKWYKSLGFVANKGRNKDYSTRETMLRFPRSQNPAQFYPPNFKKLGMTPVEYYSCLDPINPSYRSKGGVRLEKTHPHKPLRKDHSKVYFQLHAMRRPWDFYGTIQGKCPSEFKSLSKLFKGDDLGVRVGGPIYSVLQRNNKKWAIEGHKRSLYMTDVVFTVRAALIKTVRTGGDKGPGGYVDGKYQGVITSTKQNRIVNDWYYNRDYMLQQGYRQVVFNPKFNDSFLYIDPERGINPWEYNRIKTLQERLAEEFPIYTAKEVYLLADPYKLAHPKAKGFPYLMLAWGINEKKDNDKYKIMIKKNTPPPYTITRQGKPQ